MDDHKTVFALLAGGWDETDTGLFCHQYLTGDLSIPIALAQAIQSSSPEVKDAVRRVVVLHQAANSNLLRNTRKLREQFFETDQALTLTAKKLKEHEKLYAENTALSERIDELQRENAALRRATRKTPGYYFWHMVAALSFLYIGVILLIDWLN